MEFYKLEPFGEMRGDYRAAMVASTVANSAGMTGEDKKPLKPSDFMPFQEKYEEEPILEPDPETQTRLMMAALFGLDKKVHEK